MQPYFVPYLGYFGLIKHTDHWVVFDTPQFIRHGWIERNRTLKPGGGWQYVMVPLEKADRFTPIKDMKIRVAEDWGQKILAQLAHYRKRATYFDAVTELLAAEFKTTDDSIARLDVRLLKRVCEYLGLPFQYTMFSESGLAIGPVNAPDEWALEIAKALHASAYYNPPGGVGFFDPEKYHKAGIDLRFLNIRLRPYRQFSEPFEPGLSIIDVMMFNSPEEIRAMLDDVEFLPASGA